MPSLLEDNEQMAEPKVPLEAGRELLVVRNVNLDEDAPEEQILVSYSSENVETPIRMVVVDFDPLRNVFFVSWRSDVQAISKNHVSLDVFDIIGDQRQEILLLGMDATGRQTIDVFRRDPGYQQGLLFTSVFSQSALGLIEIQQRARSEAYQNGQMDDASFPILIEEDDPDPEAGPLDTIRTTWIWRFQDNTFIPSLIEKIPRQAIAETGSAEFGQSTTEELKQVIEGIWKREGNPPVYLDFQPTQKLMTYSFGSIQEIFEWTNTIRTRANVMTVQGINTLTTEKRFPLQVQHSLLLLSRNRLMVLSSYPDETLPGIFLKVEGAPPSPPLPQPLFALQGPFTEEGGVSMDFQAPKLVWYTGVDRLDGGFSLFFLDRWILQIKVLSASGRPLATRNFAVDFNQTRENVQIKRDITLTPVTLSVTGVGPAEGAQLRLQQVEILNDLR